MLRSTYRRLVIVAIMVTLALVLASSAAQGAMVAQLSDFASTESLSVDKLKAQIHFSVVGDELTVRIDNNTDTSSQSFFMNELFFNVADNVTGLTLLSAPTGWSMTFGEDHKHVACFGRFDVSLKGPVGNHAGQVSPGGSGAFTFRLSGSGTYSDGDFVSEFTPVLGDDQYPSLVAAKFVRGSGDDASSYGAATRIESVIPEPATLAMAMLGLPLLRRRRRGR